VIRRSARGTERCTRALHRTYRSQPPTSVRRPDWRGSEIECTIATRAPDFHQDCIALMGAGTGWKCGTNRNKAHRARTRVEAAPSTSFSL
jgi:hypothetical protein